jgi:hypothetical protein
MMSVETRKFSNLSGGGKWHHHQPINVRTAGAGLPKRGGALDNKFWSPIQ